MLDHGGGGVVELLDQVQGPVGVVVVVVRKPLCALVQLWGVDDVGLLAGGVGVQRRRLVRVLPVTEIRRAVVRDHPAVGERVAVRSLGGVAFNVDLAGLVVDRDPVLGEPFDGARVGRELRLVEDTLFEVGGVVVPVDRDGFLGDDRPAVDRLVDDVDRTARDGDTRIEHLFVGVHPRERREQRRVDVERRRGLRDELLGEDPHVPVQTEEIELVGSESVEHAGLVGLA